MGFMRVGRVGGDLFNGGRSQVNPNFLQNGAEFPFINKMKEAQGWSRGDNSTTPITPDLLDADGYWATANVTIPNSGLVTGNCYIPSQTSYPGNYVLKWDGLGTLAVNVAHGGGTLTTANGSLSNLGGGAGRYEFTLTTAIALNIFHLVNGSTRVTSIRLCNVNEEASLDAGNVFSTKFKQRLSQAKFGVIRFLNWQQGNANTSTTWDTANRPETYYQYNSGQPRLDFLGNAAGSGATTNSGSDYTISAPSNWSGTPGQAPPNGARCLLVWNTASPTRGTVTFTGGGSADINWGTTLPAVGNLIFFDNQGGAAPTEIVVETGSTAPYFPIMNTGGTQSALYNVVFASAGVIRISATPGGAAITFAATGTGTTTGRILPTLAVGGTLAKPMLDRSGSPPTPSSSGNTYPLSGIMNELVYDSTIGAWLGSSGTTTILQNGVPISICLRLCKEIGAHPSFVSPPYGLTTMSDYWTSLPTYCRDNAPSWMIPRFEGPNELWNTAGGFIQTVYAGNIASAFGWNTPGASAKDFNNVYGRWMSTIGQAVSAVYANDRTKYQVLCGVQTSTGTSPAGCTSSNARLASTKYLAQTPQAGYTASAASGWVTHVCCSNYIQPAEYGRNKEVADAFNWYVTNAGNPTGQAAIAAAYVDTINNGVQVGSFTNGSPGTINAIGNGLQAGQQLNLITTGTLRTGLSTGTNYWVATAGDSFTISSTDPNNGGTTLVNISGSDTGTSYILPDGVFSVQALNVLSTNWKGWAQGFGVNILTNYEGGYSPDYKSEASVGSAASVTASISAATNTKNCVFTLQSTSVQGLHNPANANAFSQPVVAGMYLKLASLPATNGWSAFNGQVIQVAAVSGTSVTTNLDASAATGALSGASASATFFSDAAGTVSASTWLNALRGAGKSAPLLQGYLTANYNNFVGLTGTGFVTEFPSCFQLGGPAPSNNSWSVLEDIYQTPDPPQWSAIVAFNA